MIAPLVVAVVLLSVMEGLATLARGLAFTVAASLAIFASAFLLVVALRVAGAAFGPTRTRGIVALLVFVAAVGGIAYLLMHRFPLEDEPDAANGAPVSDDQPESAVEPDEPASEGERTEPTED